MTPSNALFPPHDHRVVHASEAVHDLPRQGHIRRVGAKFKNLAQLVVQPYAVRKAPLEIRIADGLERLLDRVKPQVGMAVFPESLGRIAGQILAGQGSSSRNVAIRTGAVMESFRMFMAS